MAIFGMHKILVPPRIVDELDELLRAHGMSLHPLYDVTEGGDIHVLRIGGTGSRLTHDQGMPRAQAPALASR